VKAAILSRDDERSGGAMLSAFQAAGAADEVVGTYVLAERAPEGPEPALGDLAWGVVSGLDDPEVEFRALRDLLPDPPPQLLILPEGPFCERVAARLAGSLGYRVLRGVVGLRREGTHLLVTKPVLGGKASADFRLDLAQGGAVLGVQSLAGEAVPTPRPAAVRALSASPSPFLERSPKGEADAVDLQRARVIVSGGRGVGSAEAFQGLTEFAALLGGAVGASRAAVDLGWAHPGQQVGLTGQKVAPDVYIAIGISGASQHLSGIGGARTVIAINSDEKAPIFEAADVGFVTDWREMAPHLLKELRRG
jgi:electron transfer flavoprotein alpha subunit